MTHQFLQLSRQTHAHLSVNGVKGGVDRKGVEWSRKERRGEERRGQERRGQEWTGLERKDEAFCVATPFL